MTGVYEMWTWDIEGDSTCRIVRAESHQDALDSVIEYMLEFDEDISVIDDLKTLEYVLEEMTWLRLSDGWCNTAKSVEVYELDAPLDFDPSEFYRKKSCMTLEVDIEASLRRRKVIADRLVSDECDDEEDYGTLNSVEMAGRGSRWRC
ncbi:hypothetical protein [Methylobacterium oryzisoli]|uniref:hypothetical protein n=1 Tax=Methylobacterium oryzisoli TaxID=3385502 RepID=UPI0038913EB6